MLAAAMAITAAPLQAREPGQGSPEAKQLLVAVQDGRLSVRTGDVPLAAVLRAIENATDLRIRIEGDLGNVRPQSFQGLTVEEAVRRLAGDRPLMMVYGSPPDRSQTSELKEIRVYGDAWQEQERSQPVPTRPVEGDAPAARYLYGADDAGRRQAALRLKENPEDALPALMAALDDPQGDVRLRALRALAALQGDDALPHLSRVAQLDPDPELRQAAVYMLAGFATNHVRRILQAALADPDKRVRQAAAQTLSQLRAR